MSIARGMSFHLTVFIHLDRARTYYALIQYACTGSVAHELRGQLTDKRGRSVIYAPLRSQYKLRSQPGKEGMKMYKSFKALQTAYSESQLLPHSLSFECSPKVR